MPMEQWQGTLWQVTTYSRIEICLIAYENFDDMNKSVLFLFFPVAPH